LYAFSRKRDHEDITIWFSQEPTSPMRKETASTGFYESPWGKHPRIQLVTVRKLLKDKRLNYPDRTNITFKKAQRVKSGPEQLPLKGV